MRGLGAYIFLDQGICRLSVKAESIFEGLHIGTLFQEGFLQPVSSGMEVLLRKKEGKRGSDLQFPQVYRNLRVTWNTMATSGAW